MARSGPCPDCRAAANHDHVRGCSLSIRRITVYADPRFALGASPEPIDERIAEIRARQRQINDIATEKVTTNDQQ